MKARMEINISSVMRDEITKSYKEAERYIFKGAQAEVFRVMEKDTLVNFFSSEEVIIFMVEKY